MAYISNNARFSILDSAHLYQREHVPASYQYLRDRCTLAPEPIARAILAHYLRNWATMEPEEIAEILREEAEDLVTA